MNQTSNVGKLRNPIIDMMSKALSKPEIASPPVRRTEAKDHEIIDPIKSNCNPKLKLKSARKKLTQKSAHKPKLSLSNQPLISSFTRPNTPLRPPLQDQLPVINDAQADKPHTDSLSCSQEPPQRSCILNHSKSDS